MYAPRPCDGALKRLCNRPPVGKVLEILVSQMIQSDCGGNAINQTVGWFSNTNTNSFNYNFQEISDRSGVVANGVH